MSHRLIGPTEWRKSSYSGPEGGECIEWAPAYATASGDVPVRDSKTRTAPPSPSPPPPGRTLSARYGRAASGADAAVLIDPLLKGRYS
jgi:hypothetical protein